MAGCRGSDCQNPSETDNNVDSSSDEEDLDRNVFDLFGCFYTFAFFSYTMFSLIFDSKYLKVKSRNLRWS